jgi:hypothetical protein
MLGSTVGTGWNSMFKEQKTAFFLLHTTLA